MKPLDGLLVVSIEQALAAPLCTARLAEAGARIIKIERAEGDFARGYDTAAKGDSSYFVWTNQGKESVVLDYRTPDDSALLHALIAKADVFVQNLAPGAMIRAGFGSEAMRKKHPKLITCDISGYGESPEMAAMKAYDLLVQAETGMVSISGGPGEMGRIGVSVCDIGAGMTAHAGVLEALIQRGITGTGSGVAVSLFDVAAEWMTVPLIHFETGAGAPTRQGLRHPSIAPYGAFTTSEDAQTVISIQNEREWNRLCAEVLGLPEMASDPRFASNTIRVANREPLELAINAATAAMDQAQLRGRLEQASIAYGALNEVADLAEHKALRRREVPVTSAQTVSIPAPPIRHSYFATKTGLPIPVLGNATDRVRHEFMEGG